MDAILVAADSGTRDAALAVARSALLRHPGIAVYVLTPESFDPDPIPGTQIIADDVVEKCGVAIGQIYDSGAQLAFSLPFALSDVLERHDNVVHVGIGCVVAQPMEEVERLLETSSIVLAPQGITKQAHTPTPEFNAVISRDRSVSERVFAFRKDAVDALGLWQDVVTQSVFDVTQTAPFLVEYVLREYQASYGAGIAGESTLGVWTDYAAILAGRAEGPLAAVLMADGLFGQVRARWERTHKDRDGDDEPEDVEYQYLLHRVHDSRPLAELVQLIESCVEDAPPSHGPMPADNFKRDIRKSVDPTGAKWGPGDTAAYDQWLYERNRLGSTRIAQLYVQTRPDLYPRYLRARHPDRWLRKWNDRHAVDEIGMDLYDRSIPLQYPDDEKPWSIAGALRWRGDVAASLVPGYGSVVSQIKEYRDPARRRGLKPPERVVVERTPNLYGASPRDLNLIGCFRSESGLGQAARASLQAVQLLGREFCYIDTSEEYPSRNAVHPDMGEAPFGAYGQVSLIHSNSHEMVSLGERVFRNRLAGRFNAAMWFWETADLPEDMQTAFDLVDELWVASEYLADVFGQYGRVPVRVIGLAADLPEERTVDRAAFDLHEDEFVFLFVYDALSAYGRKNPVLALDAFVKAFGPTFGNVRMVLKVSNLNKFPTAAQELMAYADRYPAITVIGEYFTRDAVLDLMACADVYISLHAAEGLGLTLLEAMHMGTPAICTAYSGNMDFTTSENSWLVDYDMIATNEQTGPYPKGSVWARPRVDSAADLMRSAYDNPASIDRKRELAMRDSATAASLERYAARLDAQLRRVL